MLIVEPRGGLCNRMRVIDAALALAGTLDRPLRVLWCADAALGCRMTDLFAPIVGIERVIHTSELGPIRRKCSRLVMGAQMMRCDFISKNVDWGRPASEWRRFDFAGLKQFARCYINTHHAFFDSNRRCRDFQPLPELQRRIERHVTDGEHTVGIHIRRTDHRLAIEASPTSLFLQAAEREIDRDPSVRFFLATDDDATESAFEQRFGERVLVHKKRSRRRSDIRAIQDAVVDLYALAQCRHILGSHGSSFSTTAADIGACELVVMRQDSTADAAPNAS